MSKAHWDLIDKDRYHAGSQGEGQLSTCCSSPAQCGGGDSQVGCLIEFYYSMICFWLKNDSMFKLNSSLHLIIQLDTRFQIFIQFKNQSMMFNETFYQSKWKKQFKPLSKTLNQKHCHRQNVTTYQSFSILWLFSLILLFHLFDCFHFFDYFLLWLFSFLWLFDFFDHFHFFDYFNIYDYFPFFDYFNFFDYFHVLDFFTFWLVHFFDFLTFLNIFTSLTSSLLWLFSLIWLFSSWSWSSGFSWS